MMYLNRGIKIYNWSRQYEKNGRKWTTIIFAALAYQIEVFWEKLVIFSDVFMLALLMIYNEL